MRYVRTASAACLLAFAACASDSPTALMPEQSAVFSRGSSASTPAAMNRALAEVRAATARYHRVEVAEADGYVSTQECAAHPTLGAMGVHFVNFALMADATYDPKQPEVLVYEPQADGSMKLVAAEYLIFRSPWEAADNEGIPMFLDQPFDTSFGEAAHGLPDHYELHLWLWRNNPNGVFYPWNPNVQCPAHE